MSLQNMEVAWCSWCFKKTNHELVQRNYARRNVYQCTICLNRTLFCRKTGCSSMARGHDSWDDELCALCDGTISEWGEKPEPEHGWCSWCFEKTYHKLIKKNDVRRDVYECESCGRSTLICRSCKSDFARGHPTWDDEYCALCDNTIASWRAKKKNKESSKVKGWCSWCFDNCEHVLEEKNNIRRDVYICDNCFQRTLICSNCKNAMTRGGPGWDDNKCAECSEEIDDWDDAWEIKNELFSKGFVAKDITKELGRKSEYKEIALETGMIRPFLLLVSMDYHSRNQVASMLGWSLLNQEYLGDTHAEAWDIINSNIKGIQSRTNESYETLNPLAHNCNWFETVYRVIKETFKTVNHSKKKYKTSLVACRRPSNPLLANIELEFLKKMTMLQMKNMTSQEIAQLDEFMESKEVRNLSRKMKESGINSAAIIRYSVSNIYKVLKMGGFNTYKITAKVAAAMNRNMGTKIVMAHATKNMARFVSALNYVTWIWIAVDMLDLAFGSSHARLFPAVNQIINQRLLLSAEGIEIEKYYK